MNVLVIGASNKADRYSYKAVMLLKAKGHVVFPVHQKIEEIDGIKVYRSVRDVKETVDTVTMYVGKAVSDLLSEDILSVKPKRIVFNPGAENPSLDNKAKEKGIRTVNGCTLVMLTTGQF